MSNNNGNGNGSGFDSDNFLGNYLDNNPRPLAKVEVVLKFSDFESFFRDIKANAHTDITKMVVHIHPKYIGVEQTHDYTYRVTINLDKEVK